MRLRRQRRPQHLIPTTIRRQHNLSQFQYGPEQPPLALLPRFDIYKVLLPRTRLHLRQDHRTPGEGSVALQNDGKDDPVQRRGQLVERLGIASQRHRLAKDL